MSLPSISKALKAAVPKMNPGTVKINAKLFTGSIKHYAKERNLSEASLELKVIEILYEDPRTVSHLGTVNRAALALASKVDETPDYKKMVKAELVTYAIELGSEKSEDELGDMKNDELKELIESLL